MVQFVLSAMISWFGIIGDADMRVFSTVMNVLFVPTLIVVSLGRGLSVGFLVAEGWILAVIGVLCQAEFAVIALFLRLFASPTAEFRRLFVLMLAFANIV